MQPGNPGQDPYRDQPLYGGQPSWEQPQYGQPQYGQPQYGQPQYGQPQYGQPQYPEPVGQYSAPPGYPQNIYSASVGQPSNTIGMVSMVLGIAAIPMICCFGIGIPLGIAAIVLGVLGKNRADQGLASNRGQAQAGFICGLVAVVLGLIAISLNFVI